jgi:uncharacterized membrane protein
MRSGTIVLALLALGTAAAMVALWPSGDSDVLASGVAAETESAKVTSVSAAPCPPPQEGECETVEAAVTSGPDEGTTITLQPFSGPLAPELSDGDEIRVSRSEPPADLEGAELGPAYSFADFERRLPMLLLAVAFAALVIAFGRMRGALSLIGLTASLAIVILFVVPAILEGIAPLPVALIGAMAIMLLTITFAHGVGPKSVAAMLGTTVSLALVALLALTFVELTHLTGLAGEEGALVQLGGTEISFTGLLLAGMVIGALGVLDDVTVSQASTVIALRAANPELRFGELYRRSIEVGRDHVSATVNTLVLAYVGTSLPVLLIFGSGELSFLNAVNVELIAQEIVATLVGSIGLIAAVPATSALAAALALGSNVDDLAAEPAHAHH